MKLNLTAIGHLGRDCSVKYFENNQAAINFSIACTEKYLDKSGTKCERTMWVDCVIWRNPDKIKISEYLKKGMLVEVEGRPDVRGYRSKTNPEQINASLVLRVDKLILLGGMPKTTANDKVEDETSKTVTEASQAFTASAGEDDLPF